MSEHLLPKLPPELSPDLTAALLALVEGCATPEQQRQAEAHLASHPELRDQLAAMRRDRFLLQELPVAAPGPGAASRADILSRLYREKARRRRMVYLRAIAAAVAAAMLATAITFRLIWPRASSKPAGSSNQPLALKAPATAKRSGHPQLQRQLALRQEPLSQLQAQSAAVTGAAERNRKVAVTPVTAPQRATHWVLVIRLETPAQGHNVRRLLARFARVKASTNQRLNRPAAAASAQPTPQRVWHQAAPAKQAGVAPVHILASLTPAQVRLLYAKFPVVATIAPAPEKPELRSSAAVATQVRQHRQAAGTATPSMFAAHAAVQKDRNIAAARAMKVPRRQQEARMPALPRQRANFIIELLPPPASPPRGAGR